MIKGRVPYSIKNVLCTIRRVSHHYHIADTSQTNNHAQRIAVVLTFDDSNRPFCNWGSVKLRQHAGQTTCLSTQSLINNMENSILWVSVRRHCTVGSTRSFHRQLSPVGLGPGQHLQASDRGKDSILGQHLYVQNEGGVFCL